MLTAPIDGKRPAHDRYARYLATGEKKYGRDNHSPTEREAGAAILIYHIFQYIPPPIFINGIPFELSDVYWALKVCFK